MPRDDDKTLRAGATLQGREAMPVDERSLGDLMLRRASQMMDQLKQWHVGVS